MVSFDELVAFIFVQIKALIFPGSIKINCTRIATDSLDPFAFDHDQPSSKYFLNRKFFCNDIGGYCICFFLWLKHFLSLRFIINSIMPVMHWNAGNFILNCNWILSNKVYLQLCQ